MAGGFKGADLEAKHVLSNVVLPILLPPSQIFRASDVSALITAHW